MEQFFTGSNLVVALLALLILPAVLFYTCWPKNKKGQFKKYNAVRVEIKSLKQTGLILFGMMSLIPTAWFAYKAYLVANVHYASDGVFLGNAIAAAMCTILGAIIVSILWPEKKSIMRVHRS